MESRSADFLELLEGTDEGVYSRLLVCCQPLNKDAALKVQHYLAFLMPCDKKCPIQTIPNCYYSGINIGSMHRRNEGLQELLHNNLYSERKRVGSMKAFRVRKPVGTSQQPSPRL